MEGFTSQQILEDSVGISDVVSGDAPTVRSKKCRRVAVIGGGLGGLSVAYYLRLAGFDVTIFESNERVGGRANLIEIAGYRFDTGPSLLNYPWVFERFFAASGRSLYDYVTLKQVDPSIRFVWPDGQSFSLSSDICRLRQEVASVDPCSASRLLEFFADAAAKYRLAFDKLVLRNEDNFFSWFLALTLREMTQTSVWRSMHSELARFFPHERIRAAFGSYAMYLGGSPWNLPGLFTILPYGELAYGLWLPEGGIYVLVQAVETLLNEVGVRIIKGKRVSRILCDGNRVTGLEFADQAREEFPLVVSNVDVPTTWASLLKLPRHRRLAMTPGVMTFYWAVRGTPSGLGHHTIFLPQDMKKTFDDLLKRKSIPEDIAFYVSVPSATDSSLAPLGGSTIFILVPTPLLSELPELQFPEMRHQIRSKIMARLQMHGISIPEETILFESVWDPAAWRDHFGLFDGSAFGAAHNLWQVGPMRPRNYDRGIQGLYYVGASTTPGTGMPMVLLSGQMTAARIVSHVC